MNHSSHKAKHQRHGGEDPVAARHARAHRQALLERARSADQPDEAALRARKRGERSFVVDPFSDTTDNE